MMMGGGRCAVTSGGGDVGVVSCDATVVKVKLRRDSEETVALCATTTDLVR